MSQHEYETNEKGLDANNGATGVQQQFKDLDIDANPSKETEVAVETPTALEESLRRSQRTRELTEKGQELYDSQTKKLQHRFTTSYDKWKVLAKETRKAIDGTFSTEILQTYITKISNASTSVKQAYQDIYANTLLRMVRRATE